MRIDYRYGAAVGILAAAFATLGPAAAQADQIPGTEVQGCAGACGLEAPAVHITGIADRSIMLTSTVDRSSYSYGYDRYKFIFFRHRDRIFEENNRCDEDWWGRQWHCACESRHFSEFKDFEHFRHFEPCRHSNHYDNFYQEDYAHNGYGDYGHNGYGDYGHNGYGSLESYDSSIS